MLYQSFEFFLFSQLPAHKFSPFVCWVHCSLCQHFIYFQYFGWKILFSQASTSLNMNGSVLCQKEVLIWLSIISVFLHLFLLCLFKNFLRHVKIYLFFLYDFTMFYLSRIYFISGVRQGSFPKLLADCPQNLSSSYSFPLI